MLSLLHGDAKCAVNNVQIQNVRIQQKRINFLDRLQRIFTNTKSEFKLDSLFWFKRTQATTRF